MVNQLKDLEDYLPGPKSDGDVLTWDEAMNKNRHKALPTVAQSLGNAAANLVFAGPGSGGAAAPSFRVLVPADMPSGIDAAKIANGSVSNTEFQYLSNLTSDVQTQITNAVNAASTAQGAADAAGAAVAAHAAEGDAHGATAANTANAIVRRDNEGSFSADLIGNATTASNGVTLFADAATRLAASPPGTDRLCLQLDNGRFYKSVGTSAGGWSSGAMQDIRLQYVLEAGNVAFGTDIKMGDGFGDDGGDIDMEGGAILHAASVSVGANQVLGARQAAIFNGAADPVTVSILVALRAHGLIAPEDGI